jgi:hypothetical protein
MAYTQDPGRSPLPQTGRGIPTPFLQTNISSGSDLKAKAAAKAEKLRAADKSKLGIGESKTFTGTAKNITKFAETPAEVSAWKEAIKQPGAGRNIEKESVTVKKEGFSDLKPAGPVSPKNQISGSLMKPTPNKAPSPSGMSWTNTQVNQNFGGRNSHGMSPTGSSEIAAGVRKQSIDTDPKIASQGRPFSTGENNQYQNRPFTTQEMKLYGRGRIGVDNNPYGKDPVKRQNVLNTLEAQVDKNDATVVKRKEGVQARQTAAIKAKEAKIAAKKRK